MRGSGDGLNRKPKFFSKSEIDGGDADAVALLPFEDRRGEQVARVVKIA
jgi:hypothetical protein